MRYIWIIGLVALSACGPSREKQAQEIASHDLVDPDTAKFREVRNGSTDCVIGEINAKNRMGAYTGFRPFIVDIKKKEAAILLDEHDAGDLTATLAETRMAVFAQDCGLATPPS